MVGLYGRYFTLYSDSAVSVGCFETKSNLKNLKFLGFKPLSQNWRSETSWLFKKNEQSMSDLYENKKVC